mmetsp:Transcript_68721/g.194699  ORF Transcript_68721/g.194699 Transcript_68721/m.194699 type:complete len:200 (+) Transcript_68721:596-1195(+)
MSSFTKLVMSCARMLVSSETLTRPFTAGRIFAYLLISLMRSLTAMASSVVVRSNLFKMILSANATCWYASLTLPSSTWSSSRPRMFFVSAMATTASSRRSCVSSGLDMKVRTMGTGSAIPVVSIMMASIVPPFWMSSRICLSPLTRSPRMVQHMHPLSMTTIFSAIDILSCFSSASSIEISPNSFSMIAIFLSVCSCKI